MKDVKTKRGEICKQIDSYIDKEIEKERDDREERERESKRIDSSS